MAKTTWADVAKGDSVELAGKVWLVTKIKPKGKVVKVRVQSLGGTAYSSEVRAKDKVNILDAEPLHDERGAQTRWAKKSEAKSAGLAPGDLQQTEPPRKPIGDPWETPRDRIERKLDTLLGARLVGEATDESAGYYVPPVDVSTVASHLALFHDADPSQLGIDDMLELHETQHAAALNGAPLKVNHWHTETRPPAA